MRRTWFSVGALALLSGVASAQTITYGPILGRGVTGDQMIVKWGTGSSGDATTVNYRVKGTQSFTSVSGAASKDHEIVLTGLSAATQYDYYVASGGTKSGTFTFATCPQPGSAMDVVFYGDSRDGPTEHQKIVNQVIAKTPDIVFESGDLYATGTYAGYLSEFFPVAAPLVATTSFMAVPGNHDATSPLATNFGLVFPAPRAQGAAWQPYFAFTCGSAKFIGLNANSPGDSTQLSFLQGELASGDADPNVVHIFVWFHQSAYSPGQHGDDATVIQDWVPVLEAEPKVTAVFSGHDHIYARLTHGSSKIAYVVSGGAGAPLYTANNPTSGTVVTAQSINNFVVVHIAGGTATGTAYDDTGNQLDSFTVTQATSGGGNPDMSTGGGGGNPDMSAGGGGGGNGDGGGGNNNNGGNTTSGCAIAGAGAASGTAVPFVLFAFALVALAVRRRDRV